MSAPEQPESDGASSSASKTTGVLVAVVVGIIAIAGAGAYFLTLPDANVAVAPATTSVAQQNSSEPDLQAEERVRGARIAELISQGDAALDAGKLINPPQENALVFYEQALAIDPANASARNGIERVLERGAASALAAIQTGQLADAEELMFIVRAIDPNNARLASLTQALDDARNAAADRAAQTQAQELTSIIERAGLALEEQRLDAPEGDNALALFREALRLEPGNTAALAGISRVVDAKIELARSLLQQEDFEGANSALAAAKAIDPDRGELIAGVLAAVTEKQAEAGDSFTLQRIAALLDEARTQREAGQLLAAAGGASALESYRSVLQLAPQHAGARAEVAALAAQLTQSGKAALDVGEAEQARLYYQQAATALELSATDSAIQANEDLGTLLAQLDAKASESEVDALLTKAESALAGGRLRAPKGDNALDGFTQALAIAPDNQRAAAGVNSVASRYAELAEDAIISGNLALAQEHLASAEQTVPELDALPTLKARLAAARAEQGKNQERQVALKAQIDVALAEAANALNDGRLSAPAGNSALTYFRTALELSPENEAARAGIADVGRRHVANAYFAITNERFEAAEAQIQAAASIQPPPPDLEAARTSLTAARLRQALDTELAAAQAALSKGQLVSEDGDSALGHYQAALVLDAGNTVAVDGIKLVFDALLRQARVSIEQADFGGAEMALEGAAQILPNSKAVSSLRAQTAAARASAARRAQAGARVEELLTRAKQALTNTGDVAALESGAKLLNEALALAPEDAEVLRRLDELANSFRQRIDGAAEVGNTSATARLLGLARKLFPKAQWLEDTRARAQSRLAAKDPARGAEIQTLLQRANRQLARFYLTTPENDNATDTFKRVLELDPYNIPAKLGFERVVERYMVLAEQELSKGNKADVKRFIELAASVVPGYGDSRPRAIALLEKIGVSSQP